MALFQADIVKIKAFAASQGITEEDPVALCKHEAVYKVRTLHSHSTRTVFHLTPSRVPRAHAVLAYGLVHPIVCKPSHPSPAP